MVNRYTQFRPYEFELYQPNLQLLNSTLGLLQKRFDTNKAFADQLKDTMIDALPQDRARANEIQSKYSSQIDNIVAAYKGDYSKATNALYEMQSAMKKDFGKGGEAAAIQGNYDAFMGWNKRQQERIGKKEITAEDYTTGRNYFITNFGGTGTQDEFGNFNDISYGLEEIAEAADPNKMIQEMKATVTPEEFKKQRTIFKNGLQIDVTEGHKGVTKERLQAVFEPGLTNDPKLTAYLRQKFMFAGADPAQVTPYLKAYAAERAGALAYMDVDDLQKAERDPLAIAKYKEDRKDMRQKDQQEFEQRFQFDPTINNVTPYKPLEESILEPTLGFWENFGIGLGSVGPMGAQTRTDFAEGELDTYRKAARDSNNLGEIMKKPELVSEYGIMPQLMDEFVKDRISTLSRDPQTAQKIYELKYGKDKAWTREFDKGVIDMYNKDIPNHQRAQPVSMVLPYDNGGKEIINTVYSSIKSNPSQVQVFKLGTDKYMTAKEAGFDGEELVVDKSTGKGSELTHDVRYMVPQPFVPQGGILVNKGGEQWVVVDQDESRYTMNKQIGNAFAGIYSQGRRTGSPFPIGSNANGYIYATPKLNLRGGYGQRTGEITYDLYQNGQPYTDSKGNAIEYTGSYSELLKQMPVFKDGLFKKMK